MCSRPRWSSSWYRTFDLATATANELWHQMGIDLWMAAALFSAGWVLALGSLGFTDCVSVGALLSEAKDIARATLLVLAITLSTLFIFHLDNVSRLFLVLLFVVQPLVTLTGRAVLRYGFGALRRRGYNTRFMLVVGTGSSGPELRRPCGEPSCAGESA